MTSKDALEILNIAWSGRKDRPGYPDFDDINEALYNLEQDIDRLELMDAVNGYLHNKIESLQSENYKLKKVIEILKGRICIHQGYICYDAYADIKLTDEEIKLLKEYL